MPSSPAKGGAARKTTASRRSRPAASIDKAVARLHANGARDLALVDLIALAEHAIGSLQNVFSALDASLLSEFDAIATSIARTREDIARLQPGDLSKRHIPAAGRELAAVVKATENATHRIMEAAERMLESDASDLATYRAVVEGEVTSIFEACSFQDITGQRVSKVVGALEDIDERVGNIARALGTEHASGSGGKRESARARRRNKLILHGPALDGGDAQDDVDQLMRNG